MKLLSGIVGLTLASVVALASANAADMYRAPESGGGYKDGPGYVSVNWSGFYAGVNGGYGWGTNTDVLSPAGGFGGGQIGYNFQRGNIVFGGEADIQGADISDTGYGLKSKMNWFGTVRGRVGYAFNRALVYGTGGFAFGGVNNDGYSETQTGWVLGGGVEYKLTPAWSVKGEYQYLDLGASNVVGPLGDGTGNRTQVSTVRAGLNYHVGNVYEPLK